MTAETNYNGDRDLLCSCLPISDHAGSAART